MDPEGNLLIADGFTALYDRHARALYRYCARRVGPDLAEDAVAQTFLIAYERRNVIESGTADPLPWLFGVATNVLFRYRRDEVRGYQALARTGADPVLAPAAAVGAGERRGRRRGGRGGRCGGADQPRGARTLRSRRARWAGGRRAVGEAGAGRPRHAGTGQPGGQR
ncbi:hypothetical protein GCM10010399_92430 [Dactylosporangium fulvum]|uniref:Sigma-70 family RNA polymerase sigma factor n=1 Tax=Dactylosporangium fulvum TaxID=53359 RepID=A0ABY5VXS8_9ACTN|nr:sigma-70 family RNA polymerase sigma factor [Dactylosporangium fulvum]UWP81859.1 sigma-70 family RNA polymerase sigma factor [Dactylosporangium fulvum]